MSLELWNTAATVGTFLVISATALAAIIQLRHMRGGNQITVLTELRASQQTPEFLSAVHYLYSELPSKIQVPAFRYQLANRVARTVVDAWNALIDVTAILRGHYGRAIYENFEYLAVLSQDWGAKHPDGSYPDNVRRIDVPNRWHDADERYAAALDSPP